MLDCGRSWVGGGCDGHIGQLVLHVCTTIYMLDCGRSWGGRWLRWTHWAACSTCVYHHIHARLWKELGWEVVAMDTLGSLFYMCVPPYTCSIVEGVGVGGGCDGHIGQLVLHVCTTIYMLDCGRSWGGRWLRWTHCPACTTCV